MKWELRHFAGPFGGALGDLQPLRRTVDFGYLGDLKHLRDGNTLHIIAVTNT